MNTKKDYSKQKTERLTISMNADSYKLIKEEAESLCMSVSQYIVSEVVRGIKERKQREELARMMAVGKGLVNQQQKLFEALPDMISQTEALVESAKEVKAKPEKKKTARKSVKRNLTK